MEVELATLRGGQAKPSSRDKWYGATTCISKIRQEFFHSLEEGLAHRYGGWNKSVLIQKVPTLLHLVELPLNR